MLTSTLPRWPGDSEPRFVLDLAWSLATRYRVILLAPHATGAAAREFQEGVEIRRFRYAPQAWERLAYEGGIVPKLRERPWLWLLVPVFALAQLGAAVRLLRTAPVAVLHAHWLLPQGAIAVLARAISRRNVPIVVTAHGADVFALRGGLARRLQRWVGNASARVGAVSPALAAELVDRGIDAARIAELPMGVAMPEQVAPFAARDPALIVFAGRLVEKKGVAVLLDAFAKLRRRRAAARLRIAGGGPELGRLQRQAQALGVSDAVEFAGAVPQEQIRSLFSCAAAAVMPSITARGGDAEGLGLVMLEAMACGCPLVVSDLPVVRGVIRDGDNALAFPEGDSDALAAALERTLADPAAASARATRARDEVRSRFGWAAVAAAHAEIYGQARVEARA